MATTAKKKAEAEAELPEGAGDLPVGNPDREVPRANERVGRLAVVAAAGEDTPALA